MLQETDDATLQGGLTPGVYRRMPREEPHPERTQNQGALLPTYSNVRDRFRLTGEQAEKGT